MITEKRAKLRIIEQVTGEWIVHTVVHEGDGCQVECLAGKVTGTVGSYAVYLAWPRDDGSVYFEEEGAGPYDTLELAVASFT